MSIKYADESVTLVHLGVQCSGNNFNTQGVLKVIGKEEKVLENQKKQLRINYNIQGR
jgi:hypothetical protein